MQHPSGLQLHTVTKERPGAALLRAVLPPLTLYAALSAVLAALLRVTEGWYLFLPGAAALCLCALLPGRRALPARLLLAAAALCALALLPAARSGAALLANRLLEESEARNAYAYRHFAVSVAQEAPAVRAALLPASVVLGVLASLGRRRVPAALLFVGVAFLEAYFGVVPGVWRNALLFAVLVYLFACGSADMRGELALPALLALFTLAVILLFPRPSAAVEAYSEHLRDTLGAAAMAVTAQTPSPPEQETGRTHRESRQREEPGRADAAAEARTQEFRRETETEQEISLPHRIDYLRIALWLLLTVALLVLPFLPFLLGVRVRRRTQALRAAFADKDNALAIRAMFTHTMDWLRAGGLQTENRPFSRCADDVAALAGPDCALRFAQAIPIWQEARYSGRRPSDEQRAAVRALLDLTAATLYEKANRRTRFRMKYIACLCGS